MMRWTVTRKWLDRWGSLRPPAGSVAGSDWVEVVPAADLDRLAEALREAEKALKKNATTWLALSNMPALNEPYKDDPRWTPWTRWGKRAGEAAMDGSRVARAALASLAAISCGTPESTVVRECASAMSLEPTEAMVGGDMNDQEYMAALNRDLMVERARAEDFEARIAELEAINAELVATHNTYVVENAKLKDIARLLSGDEKRWPSDGEFEGDER